MDINDLLSSFHHGPNYKKYELGDKRDVIIERKSLDLKKDNFEPSHIILTNIDKLASKYSCNRERVEYIFRKFINDNHSLGISWVLLDVSSGNFDYILSKGSTYRDYIQILEDYCLGMGWNTSISTCLFIIGGDDVIPIPRMESMITDSDYDRDYLDADVFYSFPNVDLWSLLNSNSLYGGNCVSDVVDMIVSEYVRFNVARLPLENGYLNTTPEADLQDYLNRSLSVTTQCIDSSPVVMTCSQVWTKVAGLMISDIPCAKLGDNCSYIYDDMFVSPELSDENQDIYRHFCKSLDKTNVLYFYLHGGFEMDSVSCYGEGFGGKYVSAFNVSEIVNSPSQVITSVACFGARYGCFRLKNGQQFDYKRKDSLLLSSIYSNVLLYVGACASAWGSYDSLQYSLLLSSLYMKFLYSGMSAGEAMLRAKLNYYYTSFNEDNNYTFGTLLMFNLFGNPLLRMKETPTKRIAMVKNTIIPQLPPKLIYREVYRREDGKLGDLLNRLRNKVDDKLFDIERKLENALSSDYKLTRDNLVNIMNIFIDDNECGYEYNYCHGNHRYYSYIKVQTDMNGNVIRIIRTN